MKDWYQQVEHVQVPKEQGYMQVPKGREIILLAKFTTKGCNLCNPPPTSVNASLRGHLNKFIWNNLFK